MRKPSESFFSGNFMAVEGQVFGDIINSQTEKETADAKTLSILSFGGAKDAQKSGLTWYGKTAILSIKGILASYSSDVNGPGQPDGAGYDQIQMDLLTAEEQKAEKIVMRVASPGGMVAGAEETAQVVAEISARGTKIIGFVEDVAASAAFWIISPCDEIVASSGTVRFGSIGVRTSTATAPENADKNVKEITSAPGKSSVSNDETIKNKQEQVTAMAEVFVSRVVSSRGITTENEKIIASAGMWAAKRAIELGLVDRIGSLQEILGIKPTSTDNRVPEQKQITAQVDAAKEAVMPLTFEAAASLGDRYPAHSKLILEEGRKPEATEDSVRSSVFAAEESAQAAKFAEMSARLDAAHAAQADMEANIVKLKAELEKVKGHATAHADPGGDDQGAPPVAKKRSQMGRSEKAAFIKEHGKDAFLALEA